MYHPFSIAETIKAAWDVIKKNYISLIIYSIVSFVLFQIISFITSIFFFFDNTYSKIFIVLLMMLVQSYLTLSFYKLILTLIYKEYYEFEFKDIVPSFRMALNFVIIGLGVVVIVGTVIFINTLLKDYEILMVILDKVELLALAYLLIRCIFCLCFIVDDDSGPMESLRQSFSITRNNFLKLLALIFIVLVFIAILLVIINTVITLFTTENTTSEAYILKIAGVFWFALSFPTVQVMIMTTYKRLVYSYEDKDDDIAETN